MMKMARRDFCRFALTAPLIAKTKLYADAGSPQMDAASPQKYPYFGRDEDYKEFKIIDEGLKITKVETFAKKALAMVRIQTDDGSVGYGQISPHDADLSAMILHRKVVKHFLGKDPAHIDDLIDDCINSNYKYPCTYINRAMTGLDTAIWDLYGRLKNKSVAELLGGQIRPIPAYGSSMRRDITPEDEASRMVALRDSKGFTAFKLRIGKVAGYDQDQWPGRTEKLVPTVRKALGDKIDLLVDANSCYTPPRAIAVGRILEDNDVCHFEEPCPYWELEWTAEVAKKLKVPVAGGEQDNDMAQWRRMIKMNAVDVAQPDICYIGGLTRSLRVAHMAHKAGKLCVPHTSNYSMVSIFTLHMLAAIPNSKYIEFTIDGTSELARESRALYVPQLEVIEGMVQIPDGPGWGVSINKEWLESAVYEKSE